MPHSRSAPSYFLVGPGHARAVLRPPTQAAEKSAWKQWLTALVASLSGAAGIGLIVAAGPGPSPAEATVRLEQLVAKVARVQAVHPTTAEEIERVVRQRRYDCTQTACSEEVAARNAAARERLTALLNEKTRGVGVKTAGAH